MRISVLTIVTGLAMIAMAWIDPAGELLVIVGAFSAASALDSALGQMHERSENARALDSRHEGTGSPLDAAVQFGEATGASSQIANESLVFGGLRTRGFHSASGIRVRRDGGRLEDAESR